MKLETNISTTKFHALHGVNGVTRSELQEIIDIAKKENNTDVIYRLSRLLNKYPNDNAFDMEIAIYPENGLQGVQHTGDYKEALDDCGRLRKGFKFFNGKVIKVEPKPKKQTAPKVKKSTPVVEEKVVEKKNVVKTVPKVDKNNQIYLFGTKKIKNKKPKKTPEKSIKYKIDKKRFPLKMIYDEIPSGIKVRIKKHYINAGRIGIVKLHNYAKTVKNYDYPFESQIEFLDGTVEWVKPWAYEKLKNKSKTTTRKKPLNGLVDIVTNVATSMIADKVINDKPAAPTKANENSLAGLLQKKANAKHEYYIIEDKNISNFLGNIEKKQKESVAITLAGGQGSMKTRLCFQLMNAFAQNYKVGHASIEEHPESALYLDKVHQYCNEKALHNISAPEINSIADVHKLVKDNDVIVIDSFSKLQEMQKGCELDKDFRKAYNGKLFIIIYQLTSDGKMRGGSKSQFDGDCIGFIEKKPNYKENYVYWDKNRYNKEPELKFNIYSGKIQHDEQPEIDTPIKNIQPKENDVFSFKIN